MLEKLQLIYASISQALLLKLWMQWYRLARQDEWWCFYGSTMSENSKSLRTKTSLKEELGH